MLLIRFCRSLKMFQLLFRARAHKSSKDGWGFKTRSADRNVETDRARLAAIMTAIEFALQDAEKEQSGLDKRVDDALARAAVTLGNESDEYLGREPLDDHHQSLFSAQISAGQRRLAELETMISNLKFVKETVLARFPGGGQE
jgi:hypothetical protein